MEHHVRGEPRRAVSLEQHRAEETQRTARAEFVAACRITDEALLERLVAMGITADTLVALSVVPLAEIAWADGRLDAAEKRVILTTARAAGLEADSPGHRLVESCLSARPPRRLRELWRYYIASVCASLSETDRTRLKNKVLRQARAVAEATGGFKGLLSKVSAYEEASLQEIARAFGP